MEISSFPDDLKTFCEDQSLGIKEICDKLSHPGDLDALDYLALKYLWGHERVLKEGKDQIPKKILSCIVRKSKDHSYKCRDITQELLAESGPGDRQVINFLGGADESTEPAPEPDLDTDTVLPTNTTSKESVPSLEEQFILGLAEFIVTRAKAEAAFYYQSELKTKLCNGNREYFSNLCVALDSLELSMSLNAMTGYLRSAIKKDIQNMPDVYIQNAAFRLCKKGDRETAEVFMASRRIYSSYAASKAGMPAVDILRGISEVQLKSAVAKGETCSLTNASGEMGDFLTYLQTATMIMRAYEQNAYTIRNGANKPSIRTFKDNLEKQYSIAGFALTLEYLMKQHQVPLIYNKKKLNPCPSSNF